MTDLTRDPIINVINNGIKRSIRVTFENECFAATVILIYSGIDTMAYLNMPENQEDVQKKDFIDWVERYLKFRCKEQLSGNDVYGARCGMLHSYSVVSKLSREGKCRRISYGNKMKPEIIYNPKVSKQDVVVSIEGLVESFLDGVDKFLIDLFANKKKAKIAENRLQTLVHTLPYKKQDNKP
jgi:hypothetical protein